MGDNTIFARIKDKVDNDDVVLVSTRGIDVRPE